MTTVTDHATTPRRRRLRVAVAAGLTLSVAGLGTAATVLPAAAAVAKPAADCTTDVPQGVYPPNSATIGIQRSVQYAGQDNTVGGSGFAKAGQPGAGSRIRLVLCSSPVFLGYATLDANGRFDQVVFIPAGTQIGGHHIEATGPNGRGGTQTLVTQLTVIAPAATTSSSLPLTGYDLIPVILAGIALLGTGGALVLIGRQRLAHRIG